MEQRVDWSSWAETAEAITCPACERSFRPNHPRRRFCGAPECPGRQRRRSGQSAPARARAPRARRSKPRAAAQRGLADLLADATLELHRRELDGSRNELANAAVALVRDGLVGNRPPAVERALTVRLLAAAAARAARIQGGTP